MIKKKEEKKRKEKPLYLFKDEEGTLVSIQNSLFRVLKATVQPKLSAED